MGRLPEGSPRQLVDQMLALGQQRAYLIHEPHDRTLNVSHPGFQELGDWLLSGSSDAVDFDDHEAVFLAVHPETRSLFAAFVHRTCRGQAQGGLRRRHYETVADVLHDGLRLSRGMTRKNALAGLWWGGGKGIIALPDATTPCDGEVRARLYRDYGAFVSSLRGCYVTAEDAGTHPSDVAEVFRTTRFATCVPPDVGGCGNPSSMTAAGVVCAMEAAIEFRGMGSLEGKTIAMQGTGNVGSSIVERLLARGVASIVASEVSAERRSALLDACPDGARRGTLEVRSTDPKDDGIFSEPCDVFVPSALGGILGPKTIPEIRASIVCGPANNQLLCEDRDARALAERGITYVPDYVANRMGIVFCGNEQYGYVNGDPMIRRHLDREWAGGIFRTTLRVLALAQDAGATPAAAARRLADDLAEQQHPIWGHRSIKIVESLVADRWETGR